MVIISYILLITLGMAKNLPLKLLRYWLLCAQCFFYGFCKQYFHFLSHSFLCFARKMNFPFRIRCNSDQNHLWLTTYHCILFVLLFAHPIPTSCYFTVNSSRSRDQWKSKHRSDIRSILIRDGVCVREWKVSGLRIKCRSHACADF